MLLLSGLKRSGYTPLTQLTPSTPEIKGSTIERNVRRDDDEENSPNEVYFRSRMVRISGAIFISAFTSALLVLGIVWAMYSFSYLRFDGLSTAPGARCAPEERPDKIYDFSNDIANPPDGKDHTGAKFILNDPCGSSAAEARQRGCRFSVATASWLPEECYDQIVEDEFKNYKEWQFWRYPNQTGKITWDEAATGNYSLLYADWEFHKRHCVALLQKFHRAVSRSALHTLDSNTSPAPHQQHCRELIMAEKVPDDYVNTVHQMRFPDCGLYLWGI